jgi:hypothetical protein
MTTFIRAIVHDSKPVQNPYDEQNHSWDSNHLWT